jgi:hypothetical protein
MMEARDAGVGVFCASSLKESLLSEGGPLGYRGPFCMCISVRLLERVAGPRHWETSPTDLSFAEAPYETV